MMVRAFLLAAAILLGAAAAHAQAPTRRPAGPILVELYTSQGCDSCAGANRLIGQLAREQDVIALTFSVDYWDYLGWRDTFARRDFTRRQRAYRRSLRTRGLTTPEIIVNGAAHVTGAREAETRDLLTRVRAAPTVPGPEITIRQQVYRAGVRISGGRRPTEPADVWAVSFDPGPILQTVGSGDNAGRLVPHFALARSIERIGYWNGASAIFAGVLCRRECAIIVQEPRGGPVLAVARSSVD